MFSATCPNRNQLTWKNTPMYVNNIIKIAEQGKPISKWQNHEDNLS